MLRRGQASPPHLDAAVVDPYLVLAVGLAAGHVRRMNYVPALTGGVIGLNVLAHFRQQLLRRILGVKRAFSVYQYGLQPLRVWQSRGLSWQLVVSSFIHVSFSQLVINMCSLMHTGSYLERALQPGAYLQLLLYAAAAPNAVLVLVSKLWANLSRRRAAQMAFSRRIYVDFSAALFCISTVWHLQVLAPRHANVVMYGVEIPSQYASYLELLMLRLLDPGASLLRQVCGVVAGLAYVYILPSCTSGRRRLQRLLLQRLSAALPRSGGPCRALGTTREGRGKGVAASESVGIAPPGTGKTAVAAHILNLFPAHTLIFCCAALPVVLGVGRIANSLGIPYAFVKGRRITPSYACGRGLATHVDQPSEPGKPGQSAVYSLRYIVAKLNLERKKKRLALKKKQRNLHDLKRFPHIFMMCDTASCAWLARQLDPNRTIMIIDEPPMGSDVFPEAPEDNPIACAMAQAMMTPAYKTIWMSATLPRPSMLPTLVDSFLSRFKIDPADRDKHVHECFSTELDRGAVMCGPSGAVSFPHQRCETAVELSKLCTRLPADPLVLKAYTERALASLVARWYDLQKAGKIKDGFKKRVVPPEKRFADLSELNHASIRAYALEVLGCVAAEEDDEFAKAFCEARDEGEKNLFPAYNLSEMLFGNAYAFPGLTLVADDNPAQQLLDMSVRLQEHMPKASEIEDDIKAQEASAAKAEKFAEEGEVVEAATTKLKFSPSLVIQSEEFLKKWCPSRPSNTHHIVRILPTVQEFLAIKELPVDERWQMLALSGAGSFDPKLDSDPSNPVYTQWVHESMTRNKLACVTAGKEFTWGANVPASTVVVTKSFAETTSVAGMLQYVGRAARRGLTTHGQAIFERDEDLLRIFQSPDGLSTEARTMERYAAWWLSRGDKW